MRMLTLLLTMILIECSVGEPGAPVAPGAPGAPVMNCNIELEGYKEFSAAFIDLVSDNATKIKVGGNENVKMSNLLMVAARNGLNDVVDELLNLNATNTLSKDIIDIIQLDGSKVNEKDKDGSTALHRAAKAGDLEKVQILINLHNADVNIPDKDNITALHFAAADSAGYTEVVKLLLKTHDDWNVKMGGSWDGRTPLHVAARGGNTEIVKLLLNNPDVDVNAKQNHNEWTPLHYATNYNYRGQDMKKMTEIVELLLKKPGIEINAVTNNGRTPLYSATFLGVDGYAMVELLLNAPGTDANIADKRDGDTPLHNLASKGNAENIKRILSKPDVDVNAVNLSKWTPLHLAAFSKNSERTEIVKLFLNTSGININAYNKYGRTPLDLAWKRKNYETAEILKAAGGVSGS